MTMGGQSFWICGWCYFGVVGEKKINDEGEVEKILLI